MNLKKEAPLAAAYCTEDLAMLPRRLGSLLAGRPAAGRVSSSRRAAVDTSKIIYCVSASFDCSPLPSAYNKFKLPHCLISLNAVTKNKITQNAILRLRYKLRYQKPLHTVYAKIFRLNLAPAHVVFMPFLGPITQQETVSLSWFESEDVYVARGGLLADRSEGAPGRLIY